jgi:hypothetical protein
MLLLPKNEITIPIITIPIITIPIITITKNHQSLIILSVPFLILGIVSVIVGILMMGCGVCCIAWFPRKRNGYSTLERYVPSIVLFIFSLSLL